MCSNLENHNRNDDFRHNNINNNNNNNNNNNDNNNNSSDDNNTNVLFMSYNDIYIYIYRILPFEELLRLMVGSKEVWYSALRIFIGSTSAIMVR